MGKRQRDRIGVHHLGVSVTSAVMAAYLWLVRHTGRWRIINGAVPRSFRDAGAPAVFVTWHSRIAMCVYCCPEIRNARALISENKDGEVIARTIRHFGYGAIRGSTRARHKNKSKGGSRALRQILRALKKGEIVLITPDGPRGPREQVSPGIATLARLSGVPIVPFSYSASRAIRFRSWDRFLLPLPFARGVFVWGEPLTLPAQASQADQEAFLSELQAALCRLTAEAGARVGRKDSQHHTGDSLRPQVSPPLDLIGTPGVDRTNPDFKRSQ